MKKAEIACFGTQVLAAFVATEFSGFLAAALMFSFWPCNSSADANSSGIFVAFMEGIFFATLLPCLIFSIFCSLMSRYRGLFVFLSISIVITLGIVMYVLQRSPSLGSGVTALLFVVALASGVFGMVAARIVRLYWNKRNVDGSLVSNNKRHTMIVWILLGMALLTIIAFFGGRWEGQSSCARQLQQPAEYWAQVAQMDRLVLAAVDANPNTLMSGAYVLDVRFPNEVAKSYTVQLAFTDGKLLRPPNPEPDVFVTHGFVQEGNVLSWSQADIHEGPVAEYVGMIEKGFIVGRVYVLPKTTGWHPNSPAIGFWYARPK